MLGVGEGQQRLTSTGTLETDCLVSDLVNTVTAEFWTSYSLYFSFVIHKTIHKMEQMIALMHKVVRMKCENAWHVVKSGTVFVV